jgi:hypothetical protein
MNKKKNKITDSMVVPANGRPEEVKVGYRTIKIKFYMQWYIYFLSTKQTDHSKKMTRKN